MILKVTGYGILITNQFGESLGKYENLLNALNHYAIEQYIKKENITTQDYINNEYKYENRHLSYISEQPWILSCPSDTYEQLAIGFSANISKKMNLNEMDNKFQELLVKVQLSDTIPDYVKEEFKKLKDPDIIFMAGHC